MKTLLVTVIALFLSTIAMAEGDATGTIQGHFDVVSGRPVLRVQPDLRVFHIIASEAILKDLKKLRPGDYLTGEGDVDTRTSKIRLNTIETVGLRNLLGKWKSRDGRIFDFRDFDSLLLHAARFVERNSRELSRELRYTLAPDSLANRWSIFLADEKTLLIGSLEFQARSILLTLLNPSDGRTSERLELKPIVD